MLIRVLIISLVLSLFTSNAAALDAEDAQDLAQDLRSDSARARKRAAQSVARITLAPPLIADALLYAAAQPIDRAYPDVLRALGKTRKKEARPLLEAHLQSPIEDIRVAAREGLRTWLRTNGQVGIVPLGDHSASPRVAEGFHIESNRSESLATTGLVVFGAGFILGAVTSTLVLTNYSSRTEGRGAWFAGYFPVFGPVAAVATGLGEPDADGYDIAGNDAEYLVAMSVAGVLQTSGLIFAVAGLAPSDKLVRDVALAPTLDVGLGFATASWAF